jgi:hypothetical protein
MGTEIHAVKTADGWRYRLWQNTADVYCNEPMTEDDFSEWLLKHRLRQTELNHKAMFRFEAGNARKTSEREEREDWDLEVDDSER